MPGRRVGALVAVFMAMGICIACTVSADGQAQDKPKQEAKGLDMVSDVVADAFSKANALLTGNLEITMTSKVDKKDDYTINAIGQRVPKSSAIKTGGALHNDEPL